MGFLLPDRTPQLPLLQVVTVHVTAENIRDGQPSDCTLCPIALAIMEAFAALGVELDAKAPVKAYGDHVQVTYEDGSARLGILSLQARDFIRAFDRDPRHPPEPFTFQLQLGPWADDLWEGE